MVSNGHQVVTTGPEEKYTYEISALGASFVCLKMKKNGISVIRDAVYFFRLFRLILAVKPDIVFSYTIKPNIYAAIAARIAGVKKIYPMVTGLGYIYTAKSLTAALLRPIAALLFRLCFRLSTKVFFQNEGDIREFIGLGYLPADKCVLVNGSGVNLRRFTKLPFPGRFTFLMIARLLKSKGVMEYLEAAKIVKQQYPIADFLLVGAMEKMQDSLNDQQLRPYIARGIVSWYGDTKDVRPFLARCSVYVLPSWREGTPRTVLEAMASGRPVITTDVPGCRETVINGRNGFLVPAQNAAALAEKMIWMLQHPKAVRKMGEESLNICRQKYDVRKVNRKMMETMGL
jgi:glycosyltransferase involved in cell wall biosynthesis